MKINLKVTFVIFSVSCIDSDNYRKLSDKKLSILLTKNNEYSLPTIIIDNPNIIDANIQKYVKELTGIDNVYSEQLYTFSSVNGDVLEINQTYISLIDQSRVEYMKDNCKWFNINLSETNDGYSCTMENGLDNLHFKVSKELKKQTTDRYFFKEIERNNFEHNHSVYLISGIERLRNKITYTDIVFNMMPPLFTLKSLQNVFEVVLNKKLLDPAFRRTIADKVEATNEYECGKGHRPSVLFRHKLRRRV